MVLRLRRTMAQMEHLVDHGLLDLDVASSCSDVSRCPTAPTEKPHEHAANARKKGTGII